MDQGKLVPVAGGVSVTSNTATTLRAGTWLIDRVVKVKVSQGTVWKVYPTLLGRTASWNAHLFFGWNDVKGMGVPDWRKLKDQYLCHPDSQVARVKSSWNLDSWRPDVGYVRTLLALCNP